MARGSRGGKSGSAHEDATVPDQLDLLESSIHHRFHDRALLETALAHRSYAYESGTGISNERLEFLGDAVLEIIASDLLFHSFPDVGEGELTTLRAALVRGSTLAQFAREVALGRYLRLGRGEEATGGRDRDLLIASAFEAVLGAIYLDGGFGPARAFVEPFLRRALDKLGAQSKIKDDKTFLQEQAQALLGITPRYRVADESGPSHDRTYIVEVLIGDFVAGRGAGRSKRLAEHAAARDALRDDGWKAAAPIEDA